MEKENTLAQTCEKLELVSSLQEALGLKELQLREASDRLLQTEHSVSLLLPLAPGSAPAHLSRLSLCSLNTSPRNAAAQRNTAQS